MPFLSDLIVVLYSYLSTVISLFILCLIIVYFIFFFFFFFFFLFFFFFFFFFLFLFILYFHFFFYFNNFFYFLFIFFFFFFLKKKKKGILLWRNSEINVKARPILSSFSALLKPFSNFPSPFYIYIHIFLNGMAIQVAQNASVLVIT